MHIQSPVMYITKLGDDITNVLSLVLACTLRGHHMDVVQPHTGCTTAAAGLRPFSSTTKPTVSGNKSGRQGWQ